MNLDFADKLAENNVQEAKKYLPNADEPAQQNFIERQFRARLRFTKLKTFYGKNYCRMTRLHLLAASAIALGRFAGVSQTFDQIGELLMPVDAENQPITDDWRNYVEACQDNLPLEVRDELWLTAHFMDIENVRTQDLEAQFYIEAEKHRDEPIWQLLRQHLEATLGVRLMDKSAINGLIPHETAIADSLTLTVKKLLTAGLHLVGRYTKETVYAVFESSKHTPEDLLSYRRTAFEMIRNFFLSFGVSKIFRQGIRSRERGRVANEERWSLLEMALGEKVNEINPLIREFYSNPSRFEVTARLKLETLPAKIWSRLLAFLLGQGLYETDLAEIPAKFRIFQRTDGSMHFIRELYCNGKYRVFDSDFIVREGKLYEVFTDLRASVEMLVAPIENGGMSIQSRNFLFYGRRMPSIGLNVEFKSSVEGELLKIDGQLLMKPKTKFGKFFAYRILRRPKDLGSIHYVARCREV